MKDDPMRLKALHIVEASDQVTCACGWPAEESCAKETGDDEPTTRCARERAGKAIDLITQGA